MAAELEVLLALLGLVMRINGTENSHRFGKSEKMVVPRKVLLFSGKIPLWWSSVCSVSHGNNCFFFFFFTNGKRGWSKVCANGKINLPNGKFCSRLACTVCAVHSNLHRESGTSLTIGAGPGTGRKRQEQHNFPFGYSGWELWTTSQDVPFIPEIFW